MKPVIILIGLSLFIGGCRGTKPVPPPVVTPPKAVSPVEGVWVNNVRGDVRGKMIFKANGDVTFQGGMEFYNPGRWDWDPMAKKLVLTFPQASDEKLQIFKLYVGDGVQAFNRERNEVVYRFDEQTSELNIAGWTYSKIDQGTVNVPSEPTLR